MEIISSVNNEKVKRAASLKDKKFRRYYGSFLIEGEKLVREALSEAEVLNIYIESDCKNKFADIIAAYSDKVLLLSEAAFSRVAYTDSPQGIIAEFAMRETGKLSLDSPFLVLDNIQDPGNMGTIIRTAAAVGIKNIIMLNSADPHSPKVVRASSGTILKVNLFALSQEELEESIEKAGCELYVADMDGENVFNVNAPSDVFGLVVGSEGQGVSERLRRLANRTICLPMVGGVESLNASVSASIIIYELLKHKFM